MNIRTCDGKAVGGGHVREAGRRQLCSTEVDFVCCFSKVFYLKLRTWKNSFLLKYTEISYDNCRCDNGGIAKLPVLPVRLEV